MSFRCTVLPVAGQGTRFLPATKAVAKELLPLVDRPLVQYAVQEAAAAGSQRMVFVSSPNKSAVLAHFRRDPELERSLKKAGKAALLELMREAASLAEVDVVLQKTPKGVGHAILQARPVVGNEAFGVMFPDDFIFAAVPVMEQLRRVHEVHGGIVVAVERVPREQVNRYGVIAGELVADGLYRVGDLVEKPAVEEAPSDLTVVGRYILPGEIFDVLEGTAPGVGGEIQLTDAMRTMLATHPCHAVVFEGRRFDCGQKLGFLEATVEVACRHPELGEAFRAYLRRRRDD